MRSDNSRAMLRLGVSPRGPRAGSVTTSPRLPRVADRLEQRPWAASVATSRQAMPTETATGATAGATTGATNGTTARAAAKPRIGEVVAASQTRAVAKGASTARRHADMPHKANLGARSDRSHPPCPILPEPLHFSAIP